jgi:hypothetical protein
MIDYFWQEWEDDLEPSLVEIEKELKSFLKYKQLPLYYPDGKSILKKSYKKKHSYFADYIKCGLQYWNNDNFDNDKISPEERGLKEANIKWIIKIKDMNKKFSNLIKLSFKDRLPISFSKD